jgi:hypothetical protein
LSEEHNDHPMSLYNLSSENPSHSIPHGQQDVVHRHGTGRQYPLAHRNSAHNPVDKKSEPRRPTKHLSFFFT